MTAATFGNLLKETWTEWNEDKAPRLGAAFSYYTIFSLAPLLVVAIAIAGLVFGEEAARGQITGEIQGAIGRKAAQAVEAMIESAGQRQSSGIMATIVGLFTVMLGASALFGQLQDALNTIWEVAPKPNQGIWAILRQRFLSFTMVLGTGFLLLVSLLLSAALSALGAWMGNLMPLPEWLMQTINFVLSFVVTTGLFAMIFKVLPDAEVRWHDVWIGAILTSLLFTLGKFGLGLYLGKSSVASTYGAAGSLVVILLWIYYAAQILFFGAEFTQVYANKFGSKVTPSPHAVSVTEIARAKQGMPRLDDLKLAADGVISDGKSVEVWMPHGVDGDAPHAPLRKSESARDREYLLAAFAGFVAVLLWSSHRDKAD